MAIDAYLQIEGIKGESQDERHKGWIECLSVNFGVDQPRSATASTSGGHTAERAELDDILLSKITDLSTPILLQYCAMGKTLPKAKFEFMRADGDGVPVKYFGVIQPYPGGNTSGHIAAYDGKAWISDFIQHDFWAGGGYRTHKPSHVFYRR